MIKENVFGERLKTLRIHIKKMSQQEFANDIGISQSTLSGYEGGRIKPAIEVAINIAEKCGVTLDWLFGRSQIAGLDNLGDVMSFFVSLYEAKEFSFETSFTDTNIDSEDKNNYLTIRINPSEGKYNPECTLNGDLCETIKRAYDLTQELRRYERDQESYEREKAFYIEQRKTIPITKIDHSNIPEEERRKRMMENMKEEWSKLQNNK